MAVAAPFCLPASLWWNRSLTTFSSMRGRPDALPLLLDDQRVREFLLDPAAAQHPADLGIVRVLGVADHDRPLGDGQLGAGPGRAAGHHHLAQPGGHQVAAGQALGAAGRGHLDLDVEPVLGAGPGRDRHPHDHHRELGIGQELAGVLDARLAHLVDELGAIPGRRRIGPGVLQPGDQADALDLDLAVLDHEGKVADGLLDLRRRRPRIASSWELRHPPGLTCASTNIKTRARDTQVPPGMDRHMGLPPCTRARGEPPDPSREPRRVISRTGPPAHFPVRRAAAGSREPTAGGTYRIHSRRSSASWHFSWGSCQ